jgi:hypothetical protein
MKWKKFVIDVKIWQAFRDVSPIVIGVSLGIIMGWCMLTFLDSL